MKNVKGYLAGIVFTLVFTCGFLGIKAEAAPEKVTGLKQTWADAYSIELEWKEQSDEDVDYQVEYSTDKRNWTIEESTGTEESTLLSELEAGATYYVRVKSYIETEVTGTEESMKTFCTAYSDIVECVTTPEDSPEEINKKSATTTSITLSWDKVPNANAYVVEYTSVDDYEYDDEYDDEYEDEYEDEEYEDDEYDDEDDYVDDAYDQNQEADDDVETDDEYEDDEYDDEDYDEDYEDDEEEDYEKVEPLRVTVTKNEVVLKKLKPDTAYVVTVYAARKNSKGTFMAWEGGTSTTEEGIWVTPSKVTGVVVGKYDAKSGKVTMSCDAKDMAEGYQAEIWTAYKKKDVKVASVTKDEENVTLKKTALKKAKFFKVRMRVYVLDVDDSKVYSEWSNWVYVSQQPKITKSKATKKGLTITWKKIEGADRYTVYASAQKKKGYTKVGTSKKTSFTIKKVNKKKLKKNTKYYYYVVAENKVGKKFIAGTTKATPTYSNKKYKY